MAKQDAMLKNVAWGVIATAILLLNDIQIEQVEKRAAAGETPPKKAESAGARPLKTIVAAVPKTAGSDSFIDPLPAGALMRLGTDRLHLNDVVVQIALSPNTKLIAASCYNRSELNLFDRQTGRLVRQLSPPAGTWWRHNSLAFSPDGALFYSAGTSGKTGFGDPYWGVLRAWNVNNGNQAWSADLTAATTALAVSRNSVAVSPDGKLVATGDGSGSVVIWDTTSHRRRFALHADKSQKTVQRYVDPNVADIAQSVAPLAFSSSSRLIVSAGLQDGQIHVWDLQTKKENTHIDNSDGGVTVSLAITADGRQIISGSHRSIPARDFGKALRRSPTAAIEIPEIRFWDLHCGARLRDLRFHEPTAGSGAVALSADGKTLVSRTANTIVVWDVASGLILHEFPASHSWRSWNEDILALSSDGTTLAEPDGNAISLWNVPTGKPLLVDRQSHHGMLENVTYSPDGALVYTTAYDGRAVGWNTETGKIAFELSHGPDSYISNVNVSPDGRLLASVGCRFETPAGVSSIRIWDARTGAFVRELPLGAADDMYPGRMVFSADGRLLAVAIAIRHFNSDDIDLWEVGSGKKVAELRPEPRNLTIRALAFSPDGKTLFACSVDARVRRWNVSTATLATEFRASEKNPPIGRDISGPWETDAAFTRDLKRLVNSEGTALISWDVATGKAVSKIVASGDEQGSLIAISDDGLYLATAHWSGTVDRGSSRIRLFEWSTAKEVLAFEPGNTHAYRLAFSPDGRRLLSGMENGTALVWDVSRLMRKSEKR